MARPRVQRQLPLLSHSGLLSDVTSGSNGSCGTCLCTGGTGFDGPTGLGTPNGIGAFQFRARKRLGSTGESCWLQYRF